MGASDTTDLRDEQRRPHRSCLLLDLALAVAFGWMLYTELTQRPG